MKRTKTINHASFRKQWGARHLTPVALAISAVFMLAGCEQTDETVSMYQNADDCSSANPGKSEQCLTAFNKAKEEAVKTAPKYATREDCVAEFGEGQCQQAPAQAGMNESGSIWMPLMAGYMMGRMMSSGIAPSQPLFTSNNPASPANGKFVDATGKNYGPATSGRSVNLSKSALAPKPATTSTITRGGFGETVNRLAAATSHRSTSHSSSPSFRSGRSFGG